MNKPDTTTSAASAESLDLILRCLPAYVVVSDEKLRFTAIRGATLRHIGIDEAEIAKKIGTPMEEYFTGEAGRQIMQYVRRALGGELVSFEANWLGRVYDGRIAPLRDSNGKIAGTVGVGNDVTEKRRLEDELEAERALLNEAQQLAEVGSWVLEVKSGNLQISPELARLLGIPYTHEPMQFANLERWFHSEEVRRINEEIGRALAACGSYDVDHRIVRPDGTVRYVRSRGHVECSEDGSPVRCVGTVLDVTQRVESQRAIELLAYHDPLTGLPNRWLLSDRLRQGIALARREHRKFHIVFIDLDNFKRINDSLGHAEGDVLLGEVAQRLRKTTRDTDTVARTGGDEFIVLLTEIETDEQANAVLRKIRGVFRAPFFLKGGEYMVTASVGVAAYPKDALTEGELMQAADSAMYDAKQAGRNMIRRYRGGSKAKKVKRMELEVDLARAVREGQFRLHYQPVVDARTLRIVGVEALLRWQHPVRGLLLPPRFMDVLEESEYIRPIGEWVLREAATQVAQWRRGFDMPLRLSLNVSARQLMPGGNFGDVVMKTLNEVGLSPSALELELTETTIVRDIELATKMLGDIRESGVGIAIDDFGTGYNSLSYLKHFPVTALKIDRSFVRELGVDAFDEAISFAVAAMGRALRIRVVAEGVETRKQLQTLYAFGCNELQGNYFSPPIEAGELTPRIAAGA
jgi:diguanylate cyclase (GGDEF)-like protein/PAS domain S-box-containing protein